MKIFIITLDKKSLIFMAFLLVFSTAILLMATGIYNKKVITLNNNLDGHQELTDNHLLKNLLDSLMRQNSI